MARKTVIAFRIAPAQDDRVDRLAAAEGTTRSAVFRKALAAYLDRADAVEGPHRGESSPATAQRPGPHRDESLVPT
jgi:predicted transcriptional regulator